MNLYPYIAGLALLGLVAGWGVWERGTAEHWHSQYVSLQASYSAAADKAKADAQRQIDADKAENQRRADAAIAQADAGKQYAFNALQAYLAKGKANKGKDLGHQCFNVAIPADLLPEQK